MNCRRDGSDCIELGAAASVHWSADGRSLVLRREAGPLDDPQLVAVDVVSVASNGGAERALARLSPLRRFCDEISVARDGRIAWVAHERGRQELWSARLGGAP